MSYRYKSKLINQSLLGGFFENHYSSFFEQKNRGGDFRFKNEFPLQYFNFL